MGVDGWSGVISALDKYAHLWSRMRASACESPEDSLFAQRMQCLDDDLRTFASLLDVLEHADRRAASHAVEAASNLPALERCGNPRSLRTHLVLPGDPAMRARAQEIQQSLARLRALKESGRFAEATAEGEAVLVKARGLAVLPLEAEALFLTGQVDCWLGRPHCEPYLQEAASAAEAGEQHELSIKAWLTMMFFIGFRQAQYDRGYQWGRYAEMAITRLGGIPELEGYHDYFTACLLWSQGRYDEALPLERNAARLFEEYYGKDHYITAQPLEGIALVLAEQGQLDEARRLEERVLSMREAAFGQENANVARALKFLGGILTEQGDLDRALATLDRSLSMNERLLGPKHQDVAMTLVKLSQAETKRGTFDKALLHGEQAAAIFDEWFQKGHPDLGRALLAVGESELGRRDYGKASAAFERARVVLERTLGPAHPDLARYWNGMAGIDRHEGKLDRARSDLEEARRILGGRTSTRWRLAMLPAAAP
jgi:serine/threonine-protein kinase